METVTKACGFNRSSAYLWEVLCMLDDFLCACGPWAEQLSSRVFAARKFQFSWQVPKGTPEPALLHS